jgi:hypothetical protein
VLAFYRDVVRVATRVDDLDLRANVLSEARAQMYANASAPSHTIDYLIRQGRRKLKLVSSPGFVGIS